jgi:hypothetical protein
MRRGRSFTLGLALTGVLLGSALLVAATGAFRPAAANRYSAEMTIDWFDLTLDLAKATDGFTPPVASRAFGYLGVALYETVQPGMPGYRTLAGQLNELEGVPRTEWFRQYHWPTAANAALASLARKLFATAPPLKRVAIDLLEESYAQDFITEVDVATFRRSELWGKAVADAVFAWSLTDGGHEGYLRNFPAGYSSPDGSGHWESTPPAYDFALQPDWGENRPFVLPTGDECPAAAPHPYSEDPNSHFYHEALEVYTLGRQRTVEQTELALFWADDPGRTATSSGHWLSILNQVLLQEEATLDVAAEAYAKLGIAVADSSVACWRTKYLYNVMRPITYIQRQIDPTWNHPTLTDPVITSPSPEYTADHAVQSAAAATVLTELFGEKYAFTDHTHTDAGMAPRSYTSFADAANEAASSGLYGGIHYRFAIEAGLAQGRCVGERVVDLAFH